MTPRRFVLAAGLVVGCHQPLVLPLATTHGSTALGPADGRPRPVLACEAAVAFVLEHDDTLRAARAGLPVSRARVAAAGRWDRPELRLRDDIASPGEAIRVTLHMDLPVPGVAGAEENAALAQVLVTQAELTQLAALLTAEVQIGFAELRHAVELTRLEAEAAAGSAAFHASVTERRQAGLTTNIAATEAALSASLADVEKGRAANAERGIREGLERRFGLTPELNGPCLSAPPVPISAATVRAAEGRAQVADAKAFAERRKLWLWPTSLEIGWSRDVTGSTQDDRLLAEIALPLPLPGTDAADVASAAAQQALEVAHADRRTWEIARAEAASNHDAARLHLERLEREAPAIEAARRLAKDAEAEGATADDLTRLQARIFEWGRQRSEAALVLATRLAEWQRLEGTTR